MKHFLTLACALLLITSCSISETIIFNEQMGGVFRTTFDMSEMMSLKAGNDADATSESLVRKDTAIAFNTFIAQHKDSIARLPKEVQKQLYDMKDVVLNLTMDDNGDVFSVTMNKPFAHIDELKGINEQMEIAMNVVRSINENNQDDMAPLGNNGYLSKSESVDYTFVNNRFIRTKVNEDALLETEMDDDPFQEEIGTDETENPFDEMFKESFYSISYTFPKPIKSVSNANVVLSDDRKTMTLKTDMHTINKDPKILNLEIVLED